MTDPGGSFAVWDFCPLSQIIAINPGEPLGFPVKIIISRPSGRKHPEHPEHLGGDWTPHRPATSTAAGCPDPPWSHPHIKQHSGVQALHGPALSANSWGGLTRPHPLPQTAAHRRTGPPWPRLYNSQRSHQHTAFTQSLRWRLHLHPQSTLGLTASPHTHRASTAPLHQSQPAGALLRFSPLQAKPHTVKIPPSQHHILVHPIPHILMGKPPLISIVR